ncbi:hypothetical protein CRG98_006727 [Punica granatum]|uniref:Uncharacterized protein n=1 Tax=Punica granatum TaxID=22663 RepID=A0A2I0KWM9_PUNGR|nr:hypothetical protein CRG98_006727 [Punica granatum]
MGSRRNLEDEKMSFKAVDEDEEDEEDEEESGQEDGGGVEKLVAFGPIEGKYLGMRWGKRDLGLGVGDVGD